MSSTGKPRAEHFAGTGVAGLPALPRRPKPPVKHVTVRFPRELLAAVRRSAVANYRSQNAEIVHLVATSLGLVSEQKDGAQ